MRVLITALVPSHLVPIVPLTWALRAAGHQVLVIGDDDLVSFAGSAGLDTWRIGDGGARRRLTRPGAVPMTDRTAMDRRPKSEWDQAGERWRTRLDGYLDELIEIGRGWEADVVVTDPVEFGGLIAAAALGVPGIVHRWGPDDFTSSLLRQAKIQLGELCVRYGAADGFPDPGLIIDPSPASLLPDGDNTPGLLTRYVPYGGTATLPDRAVRRPERPRALLCLGMWHGRVLAETGELPAGLRHVLSACAGLGVDVLFPIAAQYHALLTDLPATVHVVEETPIGPLMRHTAFTVHHGGSGTSMTSFAAGVPQLVIPGDKPFLRTTGQLVERSGAGRTLASESEQHDADLVREVLSELLDGEHHRKAARAVAAEIARLPGPAELVGVMERVF